MNFKFIIDLLLRNLEPVATWLAKLLDKTKVNNPLSWLAIVSVLFGLNYFGQNCVADFCLSETAKAIIDFVSLFVAALIGSRTTQRVQNAELAEKSGE